MDLYTCSSVLPGVTGNVSPLALGTVPRAVPFDPFVCHERNTPFASSTRSYQRAKMGRATMSLR